MSNQQSGGDEASGVQEDDWKHIKDPIERRKVQSRNAQRKFRQKERERKEEDTRNLEDTKRAGSAYESPKTEDLKRVEGTGPPWGSLSIRHVVETGRAKERGSRRTSRESSATSESRRANAA
ncbi:MAG: hypothetical protein M1825_004729 [Sarcosagium campestre]|nr:MAG: hypothetical protein M1825_004729 [Sarcosagium campestre]